MDERVELARRVRQALWQAGFAYGNPPRLWRVSPQWYLLDHGTWQEICRFGQLLPGLRRRVDRRSDNEPYYVRADLTLDQHGRLALTELNGTPVWDLAVQWVRQIYHEAVGLPEGSENPFRGGAAVIRQTLCGLFARQRVVILLSPDRLNYAAEYRCLAAYLAEGGLRALVSDDPRRVQPGDVVYRTFTEDWLQSGKSWEGVDRLRGLIETGQVRVWPAFSALEDKTWMAWVYQEGEGPFTVAEKKAWRVFVPWSGLVDRRYPLHYGGQEVSWSSEVILNPRLVGVAFVLKRARGAQARDVTFSSSVRPKVWRQRLEASLQEAQAVGRPTTFILQEEIPTLQHAVIYLDDRTSSLVEDNGFRLRLCLTFLVRGEKVVIADAEATLRQHPLVHGAADAVVPPVAVRKGQVGFWGSRWGWLRVRLEKG